MEGESAPDYIQLDSELKTEINVRFWLILFKIIALSWIGASIFLY